MRVGIVRTDLGSYGLYLSDFESRVQRDFSSEPAGQSRQVHYATDAMLDAALVRVGVVSERSIDIGVTANTAIDDTLRIRKNAADPFSVIVVPAGVVTPKTVIRDALNSGFSIANIPFVAEILGVNQIQINSTAILNSGPTARLEIDSVVNGSTLNTAVGFPVGGAVVTGLPVGVLRAVTYPAPLIIDVSAPTILGLSTWALLSVPQQNILVEYLAEVIAPRFVETGQVLLSFVDGILAKMRSPTFQPGGPVKAILPAGIAAAILQDNGVTPFSV